MSNNNPGLDQASREQAVSERQEKARERGKAMQDNNLAFQVGYNSGPMQAPSPIPTEPTAAGESDQGFWGDMVDAAQMGGAQAVAGGAETVHQITGSESVGNFSKAMNNLANDQINQMSAEGQQAMQRQFFTEDADGNMAFGDAWTSPRAMAMQLSTLAGQMVPQIAAGFGLGGLGAKVAGNILVKAATRHGLAKGMAPAVAAKYAETVTRASFGTAGQSLAGAGIAGGMIGNQARDEVMSMTGEDLNQSEAFGEIYHSLTESTPDLSVRERRAMAKTMLAERVSGAVQRDPALIATNLVLDATGGYFIDRILRGVGTGSRLMNATQQTVAQGITEAGQGGMEQYALNSAMIDEGADTSRERMDGVAVNALNEGVMGGMFGGILGASGRKGEQKQSQEQPVQQERSDETTEQKSESAPAPVVSKPEMSLSDAVEQIKAERGQYRGIDDDIRIAEEQGFTDEAVRLRAAKRNFEMAADFANEGDTESAKRFNERALKIYREVTQMGEPDAERESKASLPAEYVAVGEFISKPAELPSPASGETFDEMEALVPEVSDYEPDPARALPQTVDAPYFTDQTDVPDVDYESGPMDESDIELGDVQPPLPEVEETDLAPLPEVEEIDEIPYRRTAVPEKSGMKLQPKMDGYDVVEYDAPDRGVNYDNLKDEIRKAKLPKNLEDGRLLREPFRNKLKDMGAQLVKGGGIVHLMDEHGRITGRTKSLNPDWFQNAPDDVKRIGVAGMQASIKQALDGRPIGKGQARAVRYLLDVFTDERNDYARTTARPEREQLVKFRKVLRGELSPVEAGFAESVEVPKKYSDAIKRIASSMDQRFTDNDYEQVPGGDGIGRALADDVKEALDAGLPEPVVTEIAKQFGSDPVEFSLRLFVFTEAHKNGQEITPASVVRTAGQREVEGQAADRKGEDPEWTKGESEPEPEEILTSYTEQDIADREAAAKAASSKRPPEPEPSGEFLLTGSNREADELAARGQGDLLSQPENNQDEAPAPAGASLFSPHDFIESPDGGVDYGEITPDMAKAAGRQAGKIRLERGDESFGLTHIEMRHGDELRKAGYRDAQEFVYDTARHIDQIWKPEKTRQIVAIHKLKNNNMLFVELQPERDDAGDYYTVKTAFISRKAEKKGWGLMWDARAQASDDSGDRRSFAEPSPENTGSEATNPSSKISVAPKQPIAQPILNSAGKPFKNIAAARVALKKNPGHEITPVDGGYELRPEPEGAATAPNGNMAEPPRTGALDVNDDLGADLNDEIDASAHEAATSPLNDKPEPTAAQIEAGNYEKGHVVVHGLDISIENPRGSQRSGADPDGKKWSVTMAHHYGYIKGSTGADGEHMDVYLGKNPESEKVFIVDQVNADGSFDEHKVMLGFLSKAQAIAGYKANYEKGWKVGPVTEMTMPEFKEWLDSDNTGDAVVAVPDVIPASKLEEMIASKLSGEQSMDRDHIEAKVGHFLNTMERNKFITSLPAYRNREKFPSESKAQALESKKIDEKRIVDLMESSQREPGNGRQEIHAGPPHEAVDLLMRRLSGGETVPVSDVLRTFELLVADPDATKAALAKLKKDDLKKIVTGYVFSDTKKDQLVRKAYGDLIGQFRFIGNKSGVISWTHGEDTVKLTRDHINSLTDADVAEYAADRKAKIDERINAIQAHAERLRNPQSLDDYKEVVRVKGVDSLTPEQRTTYDRLLAVKAMEDKPRDDVKKGFDSDGAITTEEPVEGKNSKTGETIFNVKVVERLGTDKFKDAAGFARRIGGGYWKGNFYFPTLDKAEQFRSWIGGNDVDLSADIAEKLAKQKAANATKLKGMAERLKESAESDLNVDRKQNTIRRADMAASARAKAERAITTAEIMAKVADGEAPLLSKMKEKVQAELLERYARNLANTAKDELVDRDNYSRRSFKAGVTPEQMVESATMPLDSMYPDSLSYLASDMEKVKGFKRTAASLRSLARTSKDGKPVAISERVRASILEYSTKHRDSYSTFVDLADNRKRLERMGITSLPILRAALVEFINLKQASSKPTKNSRSADLEDGLRRTVLGNRKAFNDFFPTPESTADEVSEIANIEPGMTVLEPSAGNGMLADAAKRAGGKVDVVEIAGQLREILEDKGHNIVGGDFLSYESGEKYDRVIMNPPFSKNQDIEHVGHAYTMLKPGGRMVAIVSSMAGERADGKNKAFREFLDSVSADEQPLPAGAFKSSLNPTGVSTKLLIIDKPDKGSDSAGGGGGENSSVLFSKSRGDDISGGVSDRLNAMADALRSRGPENLPVSGNTADQVSEWIKGAEKDLGIKINVVQRKQDLPASVIGAIIANGIEGFAGSFDGVYHMATGETYLIADAIQDQQSAIRTVLHEALGHGGVIDFLRTQQDNGGLTIGEQLDYIFRKAGVKAINEKIDRYDFDYTREHDRRTAVLEYIAHLAEEGKQMGMVLRVVAALRDFIRKVFPQIEWTETDTLALIAKGRKHLSTTGKRGMDARRTVLMQKGRAKTDTTAFRKWFNGSKVVDSDGKPLVVYRGINYDAAMFKPNADGLIWTTPSAEYASDPHYGGRAGGSVYPVFVSAKKLFDSSNREMAELLRSVKSPLFRAAASGDFRALKDDAVVSFLKDKGFDGFRAVESEGQESIAVFEPTQIKSAISNNGDFDGRNPNILFRLSGALANDASLTDDQKAALSKIGPKSAAETAADRFREVADRWRTKVRQGMADRFASLLDLDKQLLDGNVTSEENITKSSWVKARMSNAAGGAVSAMMNSGRIYLDSDQGVVDVKEGTSGLVYTLNKLGSAAEVERFMGWIAGNRGEKLMSEGRENLFTPADIDALKTLNTGNTADGRDRSQLYGQVFEEFQQHRDDVLAIAEKAGIITSDNREMWANEFYVPFYRLDEDADDVTGPRVAGGLSRQQAYKKLKGGTQNLNDLLQNTIMNFHHLMDASLKNMAATQAIDNALQLDVVEQTTEAARDKKQSTFVLRNGEKVWYDIADPLVYQALTSLNSTGMNSTAMKVMRAFKRTFTNLTTSTPQFIIANLIRDSLSAISVTDMKYNAAGNVASGLKSFGILDRNGYERARLMASGGAFSFGHAYGEDAESIRFQIDGQLRRGKILSNPKALLKFGLKPLQAGWDRWQDINNSFENANRMAAFKQAEEAGKGKLYAAFQARDLMDFSAHGAWPAVRFLIDTVPFLNARLQGLDKLYRSGIKPTTKVAMQMLGVGSIETSVSERKAAARFSAVVGSLAAATMALYLHNRDDDDYEKAEDWLKDTYWWIRIPGTEHVGLIPKPFEVGAIATLAERLLEQAVDDKATGELFRERLGHMITSTFAFSAVPQMFQPLLDVYANKDSFTGRDIESMGQQRLSPASRTNDRTTLAAEGLGSTMQAALGADNKYTLSPIQIDYLISGYLGQVGSWVVSWGDVLRGVLGGVDEPAKHWYENQPVRRFYRNMGDPQHDKRTTLFYESLREAGRLQADLQQLRAEGELAKASELLDDNRDILGVRLTLDRVNRRVSALNARIKQIKASQSLSADEKRRQIDLLKLRKQQLIEKVMPLVEKSRQ